MRITFPIRPLLTWYGREARDLPWRRTSDPYAIWISETMLQQTQAQTVIPFWNRWMRLFPTITSLAQAHLDLVLKAWEGLGYYRRARNLHRAAQILHNHFRGKFPSDFNQILALPGIGRYTAGAISSIAFHQPHPAVDGNVIRVFSRFYAIRQNSSGAKTTRKLWQLATELAGQSARAGVPPGRLNQALMELGALICTPRAPKCPSCPLQNDCAAYKNNLATQLPRSGKRPRIIPKFVLVLILKKNGRYLLRRRSPGQVNGLLWEFPNFELSNPDAALPLLSQLLGSNASEHLGALKHSITRYRIHLQIYRAHLPKKSRVELDGIWQHPSHLQKLAFPSAHKKILTRFLRIPAAKI